MLGKGANAMSIFGNLFKKKPVIELQDPVFGLITYIQGIWTFLPTKTEDGFMIVVDGPETGPSDQQRSFFKQLRSGLPEYERRARDYMKSRVEQSVDVSQLSTYAVQLGDDEETRAEEFLLELSDKDAFIIHRVSFRAGQAVDYGFDD
jgi:hypothetical protein